MPLSSDVLIGLAPRFKLIIDEPPYDLGVWAKASGLEVAENLVALRTDGRGNDRLFHPRPAKHVNVKFERTVDVVSTAAVQNWVKSKLDNNEAPTANITLLDAESQPVRFWKLAQVVPIKWSIASIEGSASQVAVETLELAHMGFLTR